jgi:hypothetical protein
MAALFETKYLTEFLAALNVKTGVVELEVRFQGPNKFTPLSFKEYMRGENYLNEKYGEPIIEESEDIKSKSGIRRTTKSNPDGSFEISTIRKNDVIRPQYDLNIDLKISLATEETFPNNIELPDVEISRTKSRKSWTDYGQGVRFDLTKVTQVLDTKGPETRYEVEIEMVNPILEKRNKPLTQTEAIEFRKAFRNLGQQSAELRKVMQDTDLPYVNSNRNKLIDFIHQNVDASKYWTDTRTPGDGVLIDFSVRARNIKREDLTYRGLFNKIGYSVTCKAEGLRKFLVIHETGLWIVFPGEFCKVARFEDLPFGWRKYVNTILDGEDIPVENRLAYKEAKHYYLPFDTLVFAGRNVMNEPLEKRIQYAATIRSQGIVTIGGRASLVMEEKPFYFFKDGPESFYNSITKIFRFIEMSANYKTDGLMFTPNNSPYNPQTGRYYHGNARVLSKQPDVCKWKPFDEMTVDLAYYDGSKRQLKTTRNKDFEGTDKFPFDVDTQVDWYSSMFNSIQNGTILEFEPKKNQEGIIILHPKRIRTDKATPNSIETARDVWNDINSPIPVETLLGESMQLLRMYHNNIKFEILTKNIVPNSHLIDIGSGAGGDLNKWMKGKYSKILAIEPNEIHIKEFKSRLENYPDKDKIALLKSGGEETTKIMNAVVETFGEELGDKPVYISMMLSLSFFFGEKRMLKGLCETLLSIKSLVREKNPLQEVHFLFFTIEESRELSLFEKYNNFIDFPGVKIRYNPETEKVFINFPDSQTILGEQEEYLVKLDEMFGILEGEVEYLKDADGNKELLSKYEKEFSSMYVYGSLAL